MKKRNAVMIVGPTAVGKTEYAIEVAERLGGEIVSADSMQIYKYMDIGSAKPSVDERKRVRHHLVDEVDPVQAFSVFAYQKKARAYMDDIADRGKIPVICGGTGLYVNALLYDMDFSEVAGDETFRRELQEQATVHGSAFLHEKLRNLDPDAAGRIHPNNVKKVIRAIEISQRSGSATRPFEASFVKNEAFGFVLIGLSRERKELYERINHRVDLLIEPNHRVFVGDVYQEWGLVDEVKSLLESGLTEESIAMKGIGYKEIIGYLHGTYDLSEAIRLVKQNTRHYAKRQMTWFRRLDDMQWVNLSDFEGKEQALNAIFRLIYKKSAPEIFR